MGDRARVLHILEAISKVQVYVKGADFEKFQTDSMMADACIRQMSIIGEASNYISEDTKSVFSDVPWRQMKGLRNIVVHEYFGVDLQVVWNIIKNDLPNQRRQFDSISKHL